MGEYPKALSYYVMELEIHQKTLPANHPDFAQSYNNIADVYYCIDEYSKALPYYERALSIW
jgi:tetratricopeptide (TPR) repeat protein